MGVTLPCAFHEPWSSTPGAQGETALEPAQPATVNPSPWKNIMLAGTCPSPSPILVSGMATPTALNTLDSTAHKHLHPHTLQACFHFVFLNFISFCIKLSLYSSQNYIADKE